jgi:hypothetical protein
MIDMTTTYDFSLTNSCICEDYNEETGESTPTVFDCYGCFEEELACLKDYLGDWFADNPTDCWQVNDLPLWNRDVSGLFSARTIDDFVRGITVRGDWRMRLRLEGDTLHANLSHHDVPTGRPFTITYGREEDE